MPGTDGEVACRFGGQRTHPHAPPAPPTCIRRRPEVSVAGADTTPGSASTGVGAAAVPGVMASVGVAPVCRLQGGRGGGAGGAWVRHVGGEATRVWRSGSSGAWPSQCCAQTAATSRRKRVHAQPHPHCGVQRTTQPSTRNPPRFGPGGGRSGQIPLQTPQQGPGAGPRRRAQQTPGRSALGAGRGRRGWRVRSQAGQQALAMCSTLQATCPPHHRLRKVHASTCPGPHPISPRHPSWHPHAAGGGQCWRTLQGSRPGGSQRRPQR